jgi:hypothetical protein
MSQAKGEHILSSCARLCRLTFSRSSATDCGPPAKLAASSNAPAYTVCVFQSYHLRYANTPGDATPKKRGPKPDVLEALLKRMDGLEKRLQDEKKPDQKEDGSEEVKTEDKLANGKEPERASVDEAILETPFFPAQEARYADPGRIGIGRADKIPQWTFCRCS